LCDSVGRVIILFLQKEKARFRKDQEFKCFVDSLELLTPRILDFFYMPEAFTFSGSLVMRLKRFTSATEYFFIK